MIVEELNQAIGLGKFPLISKKTKKEILQMDTMISDNFRIKFNEWLDEKISNDKFSDEIKSIMVKNGN